MTNKFDRVKMADQLSKIMKKNKLSFQKYTIEMLLEITAEQSALNRLLAKKKVIHPRELKTETLKVKKNLARKWKKLLKHFEK